MASALQCPACGHKHRLSELTGDPIFSCEQCGRLLKTPTEYRRPEPSASVEPPRSNGRVQRGGSAARDQTSVLATKNGAGAAPAPVRARRPTPRPPATFTVPLMIFGWVAALVLGGVVVRVLAKLTGLFTGDSVIDLITGSGLGRFVRLFAIVPFWALATAGFMTLFVEGGRRWHAHRGIATKPRPTKQRATKQPATVPAATPRAPAPAPAPRPQPAPSPAPAPTETRSPAAAAPRPRRIPKRDISS